MESELWYLETQKEINSNKQSYGQISERAMNISYTLDNHELIDKTFDKIMERSIYCPFKLYG